LSDAKIVKVDDKVDLIAERIAKVEATISTFSEAKETMEKFNHNSALILQALNNK
jgi:prefoldin subunit 5